MLGSSMLKSALGGKQLENMFEGMLAQMPKPFCLVGKTYIPLNGIVCYDKVSHKLVLDNSRMTLTDYAFFEAWLGKFSYQLDDENSELSFVPKPLVQVDNLFINLAKINFVLDESEEGILSKVTLHYRKDGHELHGKTARDFIHFMDTRMAEVDWEDEE